MYKINTNKIEIDISEAGRKQKKAAPVTSKISNNKKRRLVRDPELVVEPTPEEVVERVLIRETNPKVLVEKKSTKQINKKKSVKEIISHGKKVLIVDEAVFNKERNLFLKKNSISTNDIFVDDALRGRSGKFWSLDEKSNNLSYLGTEVGTQSKTPFKFEFQEILDDDSVTDFGRVVQFVTIKADTSFFKTANREYSKEMWNAYITGKQYNGSTSDRENLNFSYKKTIKENTVFEDHVFDMFLPLSKKETDKFSGHAGTLTANITPEYNFLIEGYEETIGGKDVLENTLPNMYIMLSELNNKKRNPEFSNHISLGQTLVTDTTKLLVSSTKKAAKTVYDLKNNPIGQYFDLFARYYKDAIRNGAISNLNKRFSNIAISAKNIDVIKNYNDKKELFPLYVDVKFSTDKTTTFTETLKITGLLDTFTTKIINRVINKNNNPFRTQESLEEGNGLRKKSSVSKKNHRSWDVADLIQDIKQGKETLSPKAIYLGDYSVTEKSLNKPEFKFFRSLSAEIFHSKVQTLVKQNFRTYEEMLDGKTAYSETVLYRIAKFEEDSIEPIQNTFIPNASELDVINYIDTQVKYDKKYKYIVYAYQFVIGTKYWYDEVSIDSYDRNASFKIYQEPSLKLVEVPYYNFLARIVDVPPAPPEVNFIAYKGIDNKILILFNNSVCELKAIPIIINNSDIEHYEKIKEAQQTSRNQPIKFGGDDRIAAYEIYRLEKKPHSYANFANNLRANIITDISANSIQKASSAAIIDNLEPNKKYYYAFRAKDMHGHISNPTFLYEVEIINEHGTIFPLIRTVEFKDKIEKETSKTMKRFLQIVPTILQSLIDEKASGFDQEESAETIKKQIALGMAEEKIWGKKFRIRLNSKSTGKVIEFDIDFKHQSVNKIKNE